MFISLMVLACAKSINADTAHTSCVFPEHAETRDLIVVEADLRKHGLTQDEAVQAIQDYKRFLATGTVAPALRAWFSCSCDPH